MANLRKIFNFLLILFGIYILYQLIATLDYDLVLSTIDYFSFSSLATILLFVFIIVWLRVFRWRFLVKETLGITLSWKFAFYSFIVGFATGSFTVGRVGEISKPLLLKEKYGVRVSHSLPLIFLERLFDLLALMLFFFVSLLFVPLSNSFQSAVYLLLFLFVFLIILLFVFPKKIHYFISWIITKFIKNNLFAEKMHTLNKSVLAGLIKLTEKRVLIIILISSLGAMFFELVRLSFIFNVIKIPLRFADITFAFCGSILLSQFTFVPGGIGVTEASQAFLFQTITAIPLAQLTTGVLFDRLLTYYLLTFIGVMILLSAKSILSFGTCCRRFIKTKRGSGTMASQADLLENEKVKELGLRDEQELKNWNKKLNKTNSMTLLEKNRNPLIRFEEKQRRNIILQMVHQPAGKVIADVGCEEGYNAQRLVGECSRIYCVDIDEELLRVAKQKINSDRAQFIQSDAQQVNLPDNCVDIAISSHVLEHLPSPQKGFNELYRIVKPGGEIVINVPNEKVVLFLKKVLRSLGLGKLLGGLNVGLAPGHLHVFDKKMFLEIVRDKAEIKEFKYNFPFYTNMFAVLRPKK